MPANPTNLSFIGIAKEATKGTGVAASAYIPVKTIAPVDIQMYLEDTGMRGAMVDVYGEIPGPLYSEITITGDVIPDTISWWLDGFFGDLVESGASAPFTHNHSTKNNLDGQPGSKSITDFYGLQGGTPARRFAGCQVGEISFKWSGDGLFSYSTKLTGLGSTQVAKPTQSFTAIPPLPGWLPLLTIGGSSKLFMESGELNLKRNVSVIHAADGTAAPYAIWVGPVQVDGKATFVHEDDTELTRYLAGTQAALVFDWTQGAAAALVEVKATMTKPQYTMATIDRGKDYVETQITYKAMANTTDVGSSAGYGACKFVVQNATAAGVFG